MSGPCNFTLADNDLCTWETCCLDQAQVRYIPTIPGNAVYAGVFGLLLVLQIFFSIRYKTWGFLVAFTFGILLEIIGYAGRIWLANNIFMSDPFLMYLICLTIGPAFLAAGLYLCIGRIVQVFGAEYSRIRPGTYTLIFIPGDILALLLQAAGGGIAASTDDPDLGDTGVNIMIAGLAWQVASLGFFMLACLDFFLRVRRGVASTVDPKDQVSALQELRYMKRFKLFLWALGAATILIMIRSIYRVVELCGGFDGSLANDEPTFMIFEGPMIILAVAALTIWHPGFAFAGRWQMANFQFRGSKASEKVMSRDPSEDSVMYAQRQYATK